jgi:hypothetical protein
MKVFAAKTENYINICLIMVSCAIVYLNASMAGFLSLDDRQILDILQSSEIHIKDLFLSGGGDYFRPLVIVSFIFDLKVFGREAAAFHMVNVFIHVMNSLLVYYLAIELLQEHDARLRYGFIAALIFALHPINSEAVMWVAGRADLLCTLFFLLSLVLIVRRQDSLTPTTLILLFLCFLCSLLAKESSIAMLVIAPGYLFFNRKRVALRNALLINAALFSTAFFYLFLRSGKIGTVDHGVGKVLFHGQSSAALVTKAAAASGFYLGKLVNPFPLNFAIVTIDNTGCIIIAILSMIAAIVLFYRFADLRLPTLIIFVGIIPPILALIGKLPWTPYAERYLYLPTVGFALLVSLLFMHIRKMPSMVIVSVALLVAIPTINRVALWGDPKAFWKDLLVKSPEFPRSYVGYANELIHEGHYADAEKYLQKALSMGYERNFVWQNLAAVYYAKKDYANYEKAMAKTASLSPDSTQVYLNLIGSLSKIYDSETDRNVLYSKTIHYYLLAFEKDPTFCDSLYNVGKLYLVMGDTSRASYYLHKFVEQKNNDFFKPFAINIIKKIQQCENAHTKENI